MEEKYPGWEYQPLFNYMSEAHGLTLLKDEMDEILTAAAKVMVVQLETKKLINQEADASDK